MRYKDFRKFLMSSAVCGIAALPATALGQTADSKPVAAEETNFGNEIVVTANKREQSLNDVGMTITALSGDALSEKGIMNPDDLVKVVPGFSAIPTPAGIPVYSLRGVGFYSVTLASTPAVTAYADEIPLPYPVMTAGATLDLERVEVLKGPQGTLFGQNSTGGAINFVAAKPTRDFTAGIEASLGRFASVDVTAFASGPLTSNLRARVAVSSQTSDDWQYSYTRNDSLGRRNFRTGRLLLAWQPVDALEITLGASAWKDKSDSQAGQYVQLRALRPAAASPALLNYPYAPENARAADWTAAPQRRNNDFQQVWGRIDYDFGGATLTSVSSYSHYDRDETTDTDGTSLKLNDRFAVGKIDAFNQEVRLANDPASRLRWTIGGNYSWDKVRESVVSDFSQGTSATATGVATVDTGFFSNQRFHSIAAFGNIEYAILDVLTLKAGARYTDSKRDYEGCSNDTGDGLTAAGFSALWSRLKGSLVPIAAGGCYTLVDPVNYVPGVVQKTLKEDNVAWRLGLDWHIGRNSIAYVNVSKGYKGGAFISAAATTIGQYEPVVQESVVAYEGGLKGGLLDGRLQGSAAIFYYDYTDKQILGRIPVPVFRSLDALVNIPRSHVFGQEVSLTATPVEGLQFNLSVVHTDAVIDEYTGYDDLGVVTNFDKTDIPLTPKWEVLFSPSYSTPISDRVDAFIGADVRYRSGTNGYPGEVAIFDIPGYTTLDVQLGVEDPDKKWRVSLWSRNLTNKYYYTNVQRQVDTVVRMTGRPVTYGLSLKFAF